MSGKLTVFFPFLLLIVSGINADDVNSIMKIDRTTIQIPFCAAYPDVSDDYKPLSYPEIDLNIKNILLQLGIDDEFQADPASFKVKSDDSGKLPCVFRTYPEANVGPASSGKLVIRPNGKKRFTGIIEFKLWKSKSPEQNTVTDDIPVHIDASKVATPSYTVSYDQQGKLLNLKAPDGRLLCPQINWRSSLKQKDGKFGESDGGDISSCSKVESYTENGISKTLFFLFLLNNYAQMQITYHFYPEYIEAIMAYRPPATHPGFRINTILEISRSSASRLINFCGIESSVFPDSGKSETVNIKNLCMDFLNGQSGLCIKSENPSDKATMVLLPDGKKYLPLNIEYEGKYGMEEKLPAIIRTFISPHKNALPSEKYVRSAETVWHIKTATPRYLGEEPYDTDRDGLSDTDEFKNGTNPFAWDTDADGIGDKEDPRPLNNDLGALYELPKDSDRDGIDDKEEMRQLTSPYDRDSDMDGLDDKSDANPLIAKDSKPTADVKVKNLCGVPALYIAGRPVFGNIAFHDLGNHYQDNLFSDIAKAGMPVFIINNYQIPMYGSDLESSFKKLDKDIRGTLTAAPQSNILLRIRLTLHPDFVKNFPGGIFRFADGGAHQHSLYYGDSRPFSYGSREVTAAYCDVLAKLGNFLRQQDYSDRIIGFHITAGLTNEWRWWMLNDRSRGGDAGPAMIEYFRDFLVKKYNRSVETLRRKWRDPFVDFATAKCGNASVVTTGSWISETPGKLADPFLSCQNIDYDEAVIAAMDEQADKFCAVLKKVFDGKVICGVFFGGGLTYQIPSMDSKSVDFHVTPSDYNNRRAGRDHAHQSLLASLRLHNKFLLHEDDNRTYKISSWMPNETPQNITDTLNVLKRVFGRHLVCGEMGYWQQFGYEWYNDPQILQLIRRQCFISRLFSKIPHKPVAQIAVVKENAHYQSDMAQPRLGGWEYIANGAMTENISLKDLLADPSPYKIVIFTSVPAMTGEERKLFHEKVAAQNRMIVFMMGAGAINNDMSNPLSLKNMSELTGLDLAYQGKGEEELYSGRLKLTEDGETFVPGKSRGGYLFDEKQNDYKLYNSLLAIIPFSVKETTGLKVLARFENTNNPAWVYKKLPEYSVMYMAASRMPPEAISALAEIAGVHCYAKPGNVLYANESLILYHPGEKGKHVIILPEKSDVYELYSAEWIANKTDKITEELDLGQTRLYLIGEKEKLAPFIRKAESEFKSEMSAQQQKKNLVTGIERKENDSFTTGYGGAVENYLGLSYLPVSASKPNELKSKLKEIMDSSLLPNEASYIPVPERQETLQGKTLTWQKLYNDSLFFDCPTVGFTSDNEAGIFYLYTELELPRNMEFKIKYWNDDFLVLYFNGEKKLSLDTCTSFGANPLVLDGKKGRNRFLIKIANTGGPGGFGMQLSTLDGKGLRGLKYYLSPVIEKLSK